MGNSKRWWRPRLQIPRAFFRVGVEDTSAAGSLLTQQPVIRVLIGDPVKTLKNCGLSGERPTTRATLSAFYVSLCYATACGEMFPIELDSRASRRERSRRSTKPSRAANRRLDPQTLRESSSYALLVNGFCLRMGHFVGISAYRGRHREPAGSRQAVEIHIFRRS